MTLPFKIPGNMTTPDSLVQHAYIADGSVTAIAKLKVTQVPESQDGCIVVPLPDGSSVQVGWQADFIDQSNSWKFLPPQPVLAQIDFLQLWPDGALSKIKNAENPDIKAAWDVFMMAKTVDLGKPFAIRAINSVLLWLVSEGVLTQKTLPDAKAKIFAGRVD